LRVVSGLLIQNLQNYVDESKDNHNKDIESIQIDYEASLKETQEKLESAYNALSTGKHYH
jgi:hypothetical protein